MNDLLPPLRRFAWAHDPARRSTVGVSRVLGQPFSHRDGLFATYSEEPESRLILSYTGKRDTTALPGVGEPTPVVQWMVGRIN
ncbi:MAG: hypothetical protein LJF06_10025 [Gemmatimonadetes bacterium]|nr:hypothetical protein [Gemmatimonadota bacterium]